MSTDPGLFEIMYSLRAMRRLKPDPVPDDLIERIIEAGTMAPSGGNEQGWFFLVVKDPAKKRFIQERYQRAAMAYMQMRQAEARGAAGGADPPPPTPAQQRQAQAGLHLVQHMHEAPVLLFACMRHRSYRLTVDGKDRVLEGRVEGASIYPAVQNILLACRALGLGTVLTTLHKVFDEEIKAELGVPESVDLAALLPIGYPMGNFGPVTRRPATELTYWDAWGAAKE